MIRIAIIMVFILLLAIQRISPVLSIVPFGFLLYGVLKYFIAQNGINWIKLLKVNNVLFILVMLLIISTLRSNRASGIELSFIYYVLVIFLFGLSYSAINYIAVNRNMSLSYLILYIVVFPFALFCFLNWVLLILGLDFNIKAYLSDELPEAVILSKIFGFRALRTVFPLANGINSYATYMGGVFVLSLGLFFFSDKKKTLKAIICILMFVTLLYTDSRGALIYPILILLFLIFLKRNVKYLNWLRFLVILVVIGPLVYIYILPWLGSLSGLNILSRSEGDWASGNTRFMIWAYSFKEFLSFKLIHLVGFGEYGHYGSGVSSQWAASSSRYVNAEIALSPHNTMLSILFDYGYLGLLVYISLLWQSFNRLAFIFRYDNDTPLILLGFLIYNVIAGITESLGSTYVFNYIILFIMVVLLINSKYRNLKRSVLYKNSTFQRLEVTD